jgi:hypothetical protein
MRFLLLLHGDEAAELAMTPDERREVMLAHAGYAARLAKAGALIAGEPLEPSASGATVRFPTDGRPVVSDGPFAETKEQLGGYYILECADRDEALRYARGCRAARASWWRSGRSPGCDARREARRRVAGRDRPRWRDRCWTRRRKPAGRPPGAWRPS